MRSKEDNGIVLAKLEDGEDFFESLLEVAKRHGITSGVIINGIGMLRDSGLAYYAGKGGYEETMFREPHELVSLSGNIATKDGETVFHVHASLSDDEKRVHGGHLISGTVNIANEISILRTDSIRLRRHESGRAGLLELEIG